MPPALVEVLAIVALINLRGAEMLGLTAITFSRFFFYKNGIFRVLFFSEISFYNVLPPNCEIGFASLVRFGAILAA